MDWLTELLGGWAGFFSLTFHGDLILSLVAGIGFSVVAWSALRAWVEPWTRVVVIVLAALIFGAMLAKGLGLFG